MSAANVASVFDRETRRRCPVTTTTTACMLGTRKCRRRTTCTANCVRCAPRQSLHVWRHAAAAEV